MIPYILSDNPNVTKEEAFEISRNMMRGNKWKAFLTDITFFGWEVLNVLTLGFIVLFN